MWINCLAVGLGGEDSGERCLPLMSEHRYVSCKIKNFPTVLAVLAASVQRKSVSMHNLLAKTSAVSLVKKKISTKYFCIHAIKTKNNKKYVKHIHII